MRKSTFRALALMVLVLLVSPSLHAQAPPPLVIFLEGRTLGSSTLANNGRSGTSQLAAMFRQHGARVQQANLNSPIPRNADVVVLVRPVRIFRPAYAARLWAHLNRGGSLLIAVDPENFRAESRNIDTRMDRSGLTDLLDASYGLALGNSILVEPWSTSTSIVDTTTNNSGVQIEPIENPITGVLKQYDIPVQTWGSRHLTVAGLALDSHSWPLLFSSTAYAETDLTVLTPASGDTAASLAFQAEADIQGPLSIAGMSENRQSGGRVVILGDSELVQNGYGLARVGPRPLHPGNYILAERTVAWLLRLPESEWPPLPPDFTWLAIDGQADDWPEQVDGISGPGAISSGLAQARAFIDDNFLYLLIEPIVADSQPVEIGIGSRDGIDDASVLFTVEADTITLESTGRQPIEDASVAWGDVIELRIPRRLLPGDFNYVVRIELPGERRLPIDVDIVTTSALSDPNTRTGTIATVVSSAAVSVRSGPGTQFRQIAVVDNGTVFRATGRTADGEWIRLQNARYQGWIATFLLTSNGSFANLPIAVIPS